MLGNFSPIFDQKPCIGFDVMVELTEKKKVSLENKSTKLFTLAASL
jgi:hypothetical protein